MNALFYLQARDSVTVNGVPFHTLDTTERLEAFKTCLHETVARAQDGADVEEGGEVLILKALSRTGSAGDSFIFANEMFVAKENFMKAMDESRIPSVPIKVTVGGILEYHTEKIPKGVTVTIETHSYFELVSQER